MTSTTVMGHASPSELVTDDERFRLLVEGVRDYAILMLDPAGMIVSWNDGAERITGYGAAEALGRHFSLFFTPEALAEGHPQRELKIATREGRYEEEGWRVRKDGTRFWANVILTALVDDSGELRGFAKVTRDLTERRAQEAERERFRLLVEGVRDYAILMLDPAGTIVSWNEGAERINGYCAADALGRHFSLFFTPEGIAAGHPLLELEVAAREGRYEEEGWRVRKDGTRFWANVIVTALVDDAGESRGFAKVTRDLTERRAQEAERAANERVDAGSRAKTEFLSRMSHELRTPLNAVLGFAQLLALDALRPTQRESVDYILRAGELLVAQVDDALDIARIEADDLSVSLEPVDVGALLTECVQLIAPMAAGHAIQIVPPPRPVTEVYAHADAQRLKQVVLNVLTNAVKYNRPHGTVALELNVSAPRVIISITDCGRGIDPECIDRLFTPFERLGAEDSNVPGTGLGLALSRQLAELMGGTITAESELGTGTAFHIDLALTTPPHGDSESGSGEGGGIEATGTVLYIEDNLANLTLVERILERAAKVELISAMQGTLGLELARTHQPDLILLDLHLPDMSGEDVATALRANDETRDIPIVILSGAAHPAQRRRLLEQGVHAYLTKPYKVAEMIELVEQTLRVP